MDILNQYKQEITKNGESLDSVLAEADFSQSPMDMLNQLGIKPTSVNNTINKLEETVKSKQYNPNDNKAKPTKEDYDMLNLIKGNAVNNQDMITISKSELKVIIYETLIDTIPKMVSKLEEDAIEKTVKHFISKYTKKGQ